MSKPFRRGNVWWCDVRIGGQRIQRRLGKDEREAYKKFGKLLDEQESVKNGHAVKPVLYEEAKKRFFDFCETNKSPNTVIHDKRAVTLLEHELGVVSSLTEINPESLQRVQSALKKKGYIPSLINRRIRSIKGMMRKFEAWRYVPKQEWGSVVQLREPQGRLLFYSPEELRKIVKRCKGIWLTLALLGARAGLRRGEIHSLRWSDVDFERNRIHISPHEDWNPKDYERRWIPMSQDLRSHLQHLPKQQKYVLSDENGERVSLITMSVYFRKIVKKAGLKGGIHTLRHTFGSHLASAGVPLYTISKLMGHSSVERTAIYSHLAPDVIDDAVTKLPQL